MCSLEGTVMSAVKYPSKVPSAAPVRYCIRRKFGNQVAPRVRYSYSNSPKPPIWSCFLGMKMIGESPPHHPSFLQLRPQKSFCKLPHQPSIFHYYTIFYIVNISTEHHGPNHTYTIDPLRPQQCLPWQHSGVLQQDRSYIRRGCEGYALALSTRAN